MVLLCSGRQSIEPDGFVEKIAYKAFYLVFSTKPAGGKFAYKNIKERVEFKSRTSKNISKSLKINKL